MSKLQHFEPKGPKWTELLRYTALTIFFLVALACPGHSEPPGLDEDVAQAVPNVRSAYENIHRHPELGLHETQTAELVLTHLKRLGFKTFLPIGKLPTAVIAVLDSGRPGTVRCLRSELDARPTQEATNLPYQSEIAGIMHNCGHDAHTAILLGAAEVLAKRRKDLTGKVVFIFQPAEEVPGGADDIVADGILDQLGVKAIYALHSAPGLPVGSFQLSPGPILAGSNAFDVTITGKGSHAAYPHDGDDVPLAAAEIAMNLSKLPARKLDIITRPCIISVTYITAGSTAARNVLPASAVFGGTLRTYEDIDAPFNGTASLREIIHQHLMQSAASLNVTATLNLRKGTPPTFNDDALYRSAVMRLAADWPDLKMSASPRGMASEDFAYYTPRFHCLYFSWGIAKDKLGLEGVHTPNFTIHPDAFPYGVKLMSLLAMGEDQRG